MKVLECRDEYAIMECDCGEKFDTDACFEENLEWSEFRKSLIAVCPKCGLKDGEVDEVSKKIRQALKDAFKSPIGSLNSDARALAHFKLRMEGMELKDDNRVLSLASGKLIAYFEGATYDSEKHTLNITIKPLQALQFIVVNATIDGIRDEQN